MARKNKKLRVIGPEEMAKLTPEQVKQAKVLALLQLFYRNYD